MASYKTGNEGDLTPQFEQMLETAISTDLIHTWTSLPGIVQEFFPGNQTADIQPAIRQEYTTESGEVKNRNHPLLRGVPVHFSRGGGFSATHPLEPGNSGLIIFNARCIDSWVKSGGVQSQAVRRKHDFSDGIFVPGISAIPDALPGFETGGHQIRNDSKSSTITVKDGSIAIEKQNASIEVFEDTIVITINGTPLTVSETGGKIKLTSNQLVLEATAIEATGNMLVRGGLSWEGVATGAGGAPAQIGGGGVQIVGGVVQHNGINIGDTHVHYVIAPQRDSDPPH